VLVIEDGSVPMMQKRLCKSMSNKLDVKYFFKPNEGQGFARNYGFERTKGDYFVSL
jgi:glycosyltransferase involved in cell wall biosynthesis